MLQQHHKGDKDHGIGKDALDIKELEEQGYSEADPGIGPQYLKHQHHFPHQ